MKIGQVRFTENDPRIEMCPTTGCWLWMGRLYRGGYGVANIGRKRGLAHRAVWQTLRGQIPAGLVLDHLCRIRSCVNPDHLRVVTRRQNVLENSVSLPALNTAKTHCEKHGAPLTTRCDGRRRCIPCAKEAKDRYESTHRLRLNERRRLARSVRAETPKPRKAK